MGESRARTCRASISSGATNLPTGTANTRLSFARVVPGQAPGTHEAHMFLGSVSVSRHALCTSRAGAVLKNQMGESKASRAFCAGSLRFHSSPGNGNLFQLCSPTT